MVVGYHHFWKPPNGKIGRKSDPVPSMNLVGYFFTECFGRILTEVSRLNQFAMGFIFYYFETTCQRFSPPQSKLVPGLSARFPKMVVPNNHGFSC